MDDADAPLAPETSATPRHALEPEQSPANAGDASGTDATAVLPLGSALELRWEHVTHRREITWGERGAPLELRLRAVASCPWQRKPLMASAGKISLAVVDATESATWDLPADDCVVRVALTPELLRCRPGAHDPNGSGILMVLAVSLEPRRASSNGDARRLLQCMLALSKSMIRSVYKAGVRLEVPLCDAEGAAAGVARIQLRCGQPTLSSWDETAFVAHTKRPVEVRLSLAKLRRFSAGPKPMDIVVEVSITGQEGSRGAVRSRPYKLLEANTDMGGSSFETTVLYVDDAWTQAVRFVVFHHSSSVKERAHRLAEGFVSLSHLTCDTGDQREELCVEMITVSSSLELLPQLRSRSNRRDGEHNDEAWGELTATAAVSKGPHVEATAVETKRNAASMLRTRDGGGGYEAELGDARGTLEIQVVDAAITSSAVTGDGEEGSLSVDVRVTPGLWSKQATASWGPGSLPPRLIFDRDTYSAPVQWTKKERAIPSIGCHLTLTLDEVPCQETQDTRSTPSKSLTKMKTRKQGTSKAPARFNGAHVLHLPVLFTYPGEWIQTEIPVDLRGAEDGVAAVRLRLRVRFNTRECPAETASNSESAAYYGAGHLSISNIQASGPFLRDCGPHDTLAIGLESSTTAKPPIHTAGRSISRSVSIDDGSVTWDDPVDCDLPASSCAPIVVLRVSKAMPAITGEQGPRDGLVGLVSMPLPQVVLREQHLISFTLPLAGSAKGPATESASRKCGTLSFDMQVVNLSRAQQKRDEQKTTTALVLQRVSWIQTPAPLALAVLKRKFSVACELSIVSGKSLNQVLWQHTTPSLEATSAPTSSDGEFVVNHAVSLTNPMIRKATSAPGKSILILRLSTIAREGDSQSTVTALGQAVVPLRNGWAAFAEQEKDNWHKVYAQSSSGGGNPEAVGEIQLSVVALASAAPIEHEREKSGIEGWLYLQVVEAVVDSELVSQFRGAHKIAAFVELQTASSKPQRSKPRWGTHGRWLWEADAVFVLPCPDGDDTEEVDQCSLTLVVENEHRIVIAREINPRPYAEASRSVGLTSDGDAFVDEWLVAPDGAAQLRLRLRYLPAVTGTLQLEMLQLQPQRFSRAHEQSDISVSQLALRCSRSTTEPSNAVTSLTKAIPSGGSDHWSHWQRLEDVKLELPISVATAPRGAVPSIQIQIVGLSVGVQEVCLAESSFPISAAVLNGEMLTRWISLHARHDESQRLAIASVRLQFHQDANIGTTGNGSQRRDDFAGSLFQTHEDWRRSGSAVLALWKRLFYRLDADHNGQIAVAEFKNFFLEHTEVFRETSDGDMLLRVLLHAEGATEAPRLLLHDVEQLFADMDRNHDESVVWTEYVDFLQAKLLAFEPSRSSPERVAIKPSTRAPAVLRPAAVAVKPDGVIARELRTKRREDHDPCPRDDADATRVTPPQRRLSVRQLRSASREPTPTPHGDNPRSIPLGGCGAPELVAKLQTAGALLDLEQQKSTRLQEELRSLRRAYHQLQLQQERNALEEKTKETFVEEAIRGHEEILRDRAATRTKHHTASIVLQSKVRSRLEQKKFQALKMQRWNAAVRVQCAYRACVARRRLAVLHQAEHARRTHRHAASTLQRFVRFYLRRTERLLLLQARHLSATLLQKYVRRRLVLRRQMRQRDAALTLQCWHRRTNATRQLERLRGAVARVKHWMVGTVVQKRWRATRRGVCRVQRWWRRANALRWEYLTQVEAAVCIQAVWRGCQHRQLWRRLEALALAEEEAHAMNEPQSDEDDSAGLATDASGNSDLEDGGGAQDASGHASTSSLNHEEKEHLNEDAAVQGYAPFDKCETTRHTDGERDEDPAVLSAETKDDTAFDHDETVDAGDQTVPPQETLDVAPIDDGAGDDASTNGLNIQASGDDDAAADVEDDIKQEAAVATVLDGHEARQSHEAFRGHVAAGEDTVLEDGTPKTLEATTENELMGDAAAATACGDTRDDAVARPDTRSRDASIVGGAADHGIASKEDPARHNTELSTTTDAKLRDPTTPSVSEDNAASAVDCLHSRHDAAEAEGIHALLMEMVVAVVDMKTLKEDARQRPQQEPIRSRRPRDQLSTTTSDLPTANDSLENVEPTQAVPPTEAGEIVSRESDDTRFPRAIGADHKLRTAEEEEFEMFSAVSSDHQEAPATDLETIDGRDPDSRDLIDSHVHSEAHKDQRSADEDETAHHVGTTDTSVACTAAEATGDAIVLVRGAVEEVAETGDLAEIDDATIPHAEEAVMPHTTDRQARLAIAEDETSHTGGVNEEVATELNAHDQAKLGESMLLVEEADGEEVLQRLEDPKATAERRDAHHHEEAHSEPNVPSHSNGVDEHAPFNGERPEPSSPDRVSAPEREDSDLESLDVSDESDDLMLLDAAAVTQFQQDDDAPGGETDTVETTVTPVTAPVVERADSDKELLLDLEELSARPSRETHATKDRERVVVAHLD